MRILVGSLRAKLIVFFLVVALIPVGAVGYLSFRKARTALERSELGLLVSSAERTRRAIVQYLETSVTNLKVLSETWSVVSAFRLFAFEATSRTASGSKIVEIDSANNKWVVREIAPLFSRWLKLYESEAYRDLLLVVGEKQGYIVYTQMKLGDHGTVLTSSVLKDSSLAGMWTKVRQTKKPTISDFSIYPPAEGEAAAFVGVPVLGEKDKLYGMLVLRLGHDKLDHLVRAVGDIGMTRDSFLVGEDLVMRSNSRRSERGLLKMIRNTRAARESVSGESGIGELPNEKGEPVLNAWTSVGLEDAAGLGADFEWGLVVQVASEEAFAPVTSLKNWILVVAMAFGLLVVLAASFLARHVARPIVALTRQAEHISDGDLSVSVPEGNRRDEIGSLSRSFAGMVENLKAQTRKMFDAVNVLAESASEISATVTQLGVAATETSAAVAQTSTTAEQVKQSARVVSEKAKQVADMSGKAVIVSESGMNATRRTVEGMNSIKEQMDSTAETVIKLSDQSRTIEEIVAVVRDLANQSNLLAVNASIEAAGAGDSGKGFGVVAHEIKSLADQSKEATEQIRSMLDETQKWISAAVTSTDQGSKAVQRGVEESVSAGLSIEQLSQSVSESAQAASTIDASTRQQVVGAEQVASSMASIEQALRGNLEGFSQLESAAKRLEELGTELKHLVQTYRI